MGCGQAKQKLNCNLVTAKSSAGRRKIRAAPLGGKHPQKGKSQDEEQETRESPNKSEEERTSEVSYMDRDDKCG